jgi:hypothetical protein
MMGTINYMAPEQVRGERADQRSDIFALGVVLYELLGGRKAFDGESVRGDPLQDRPGGSRAAAADQPQPPARAGRDRGTGDGQAARRAYQHISEMLRDLAVYRQQMIAFDSGRPGSGSHSRTARPPTDPGVDARTVAHTPAPLLSEPAQPALRTPSGAAQAVRRRAARPCFSIAAVLVLGALGLWVWRTPEPAPAPTSPAAHGCRSGGSRGGARTGFAGARGRRSCRGAAARGSRTGSRARRTRGAPAAGRSRLGPRQPDRGAAGGRNSVQGRPVRGRVARRRHRAHHFARTTRTPAA